MIVCDFLAAAGAIPWEYPCAKVLFSHNVEAMIWRRHYEVARNPLWKLLAFREWLATRAAEKKYLRLADHVFAVSEKDRDVFVTFLDSNRLTVIPTGVDTEYFQRISQSETPHSLVFTGSMDWIPNDDGISYFIKEVLPLIRNQVPNVSLCVVGRKPSRRLREFAAKDGSIRLTSWVEDIRPYLGVAEVCIVPLRIGGGTRLKIFEAMAMSKPVVSTSIGAEGLPVIHGENILLANRPADFASSVVSLLRNPVERKNLGDASRKMVKENYSWERVADKFAKALADVAARYPSNV